MTGRLGVSGLGDFALAAVGTTFDDTLTFSVDAAATFNAQVDFEPSVTFQVTVAFILAEEAGQFAEVTLAAVADFQLADVANLEPSVLFDCEVDVIRDIAVDFETTIALGTVADVMFVGGFVLDNDVTFAVDTAFDFDGENTIFVQLTLDVEVDITTAFVVSKERSVSNTLELVVTVASQQVHVRSLASDLVLTVSVVGTVPEQAVIFQTAEYLIVLPMPLLGDTQTQDGELLIKRPLVGDLRTHIRSSDLQTLHYEFALDRLKSVELIEFIQNTVGQVLRMTNWKGQIWRGQITNNPVEAILQRRPLVAIDFEGIKVSG